MNSISFNKFFQKCRFQFGILFQFIRNRADAHKIASTNVSVCKCDEVSCLAFLLFRENAEIKEMKKKICALETQINRSIVQ